MLVTSVSPADTKIIFAFGVLFVVTAALAVGLSALPSTVLAGLRSQTQLTVFALVGNFLLVPALVVGILLALHLGTQANIAFALLAAAAGAPFVAWIVSIGKGDVPYAAAMSVMLIVLGVLLVPLMFPLFLSWLGTGVTIDTWHLYWPMLLLIGLPLVVGWAVRGRYPEFALKLMPYLGPLSLVFLLVHIMVFITSYWTDFTAQFGTGELLFMLGFAVFGLIIGYLLCPPYVLSTVKPVGSHFGTKLASSVGTAQRGTMAAIITCLFSLGAYPSADIMVLTSSLLTIILTVTFGLEMGRRHAKDAPVADPIPTVVPVPAS